MKTTRTNKTVQPRQGSCRWLRPLVLPLGIGRLSITVQTRKGPLTTEYDIGAHLDAKKNVTGLRLVKDDDEAHDLAVTSHGLTCDCKDSEFCPQSGGCKHVKAVTAGLAKLGIALKPVAPLAPIDAQQLADVEEERYSWDNF